jgi:hypothetical protein
VQRCPLGFAALWDVFPILGVQNLDTIIIHGTEEIVEILLRLHFLMKSLVDLLEKKVALLSSLGQELADFVLLNLMIGGQVGHLVPLR